jgi:hypothetical protein
MHGSPGICTRREETTRPGKLSGGERDAAFRNDALGDEDSHLREPTGGGRDMDDVISRALSTTDTLEPYQMKEVEDVLSKFKDYFTPISRLCKDYKYEFYVTNQEPFS